MTTLPHLQALRLVGDDAAEFADSQLSADVTGAARSRWHPAAWCDPKGRCLAVVLFNVRDDGVDLVLPAAQANDIAGKLKLYMLRRDVSLSVHRHVGTGDGDALHFDPERCLRLLDASGDIDDALVAAWRFADLRAGMPWLDPATTGRHLPQSLGLEALHGVDYEKGCFPGQEVIARVHFRGRAPRRLSRIRVQADTPPAPATSIEDADGVRIGEMLWSVVADQVYGLAIVGREVTETLACRVGGCAAELVTRFARMPQSLLKNGEGRDE